MEGVTKETLEMLLKRTGLELPPEEVERLRPAYERFAQRLKVLHDADLKEEEVAGVFPP